VSIFKFIQHLLSKKPSEVGDYLPYRAPTSSWGGLHEAKIIKVLDGDTVDVQMTKWEEVRVRLECIDCPEGDQPWGDIATAGLVKLIGGRRIYLEVHGHDIYNRVLATIYVMIDKELVNVNERMVMLGHAWSTVHIYKQLSDNRRTRLSQLQDWARSNNVNLWGTKNPIPPWEWRKNDKNENMGRDALNELQKYVARKNKVNGKYFIEIDDEILISPEGKDIELDLERFGEPEDVLSTQLTEKQMIVYQNKINYKESKAIEDSKKVELQKRLLNELKKVRMKISMGKGIHAYEVFEDKTLIEISEIMPESESMMLQIWGVGPIKYRMYGAHFIGVVKKFKKEINQDPSGDKDSA